jgi:hypothetical protein
MKIYLFRYNKITGYWVQEREVPEDTAEEWQRVYSIDSPGEYFYVSRRWPTHDPILRDRLPYNL